MDVWQDTSRGNGNTTKETVELFIVLHGKGDVARDDTRLLVVTSRVSGKFQDLSAQVLQDGSQVHWGTGSHTGGVFL